MRVHSIEEKVSLGVHVDADASITANNIIEHGRQTTWLSITSTDGSQLTVFLSVEQMRTLAESITDACETGIKVTA